MSFLNGRLSYTRFKVSGDSLTATLGPDVLKRLAANAIGTQKIASADGIQFGWTAGGDILDVTFEQEKNVAEDALLFALRIDSHKLPADLLKAYYQADLRALSANNPSGRPSARQRREAKESAKDRLEHEARDGRFLKRKAIECLWDRRTNELLFGATSPTHFDRLAVLFKTTFGLTFEAITADTQARSSTDILCAVDDAHPSAFVPFTTSQEVAWVLDENSRAFLGNEFLMWLWFVTETKDDTFNLSDGSEVTVMFAGGLRLECPRGQTGNDTINHEGPTRLPESRRAIQAGKLPRKAGLMLVRNDQQYGLTINAETLSVSSAKLPNCEEEETSARRFERLDQIRELNVTLDLLYSAFCSIRLSSSWESVLGDMQSWLARGERREAA